MTTSPKERGAARIAAPHITDLFSSTIVRPRNINCGDYPSAPGHRGVETSVAAAMALAPSLGHLQRLTLATITRAGKNGLTAHETCDTIGFDRAALQPRLSELRRKGLIIDSGRRRKNASRKAAIVWIATPEAAHG